MSPNLQDQLKDYIMNPVETSDLTRDYGPIDSTKLDKIMGEPYVKIKIKNLANFRAEPLEGYDQAIIYKEDEPLKYLEQGQNRGFSRFLNQSGELEWRECEIIDFNEEESKFLIRWKHDDSTKTVTRLNFRFAGEAETSFDERVKKTMENRYKNLYMESYKS